MRMTIPSAVTKPLCSIWLIVSMIDMIGNGNGNGGDSSDSDDLLIGILVDVQKTREDAFVPSLNVIQP